MALRPDLTAPGNDSYNHRPYNYRAFEDANTQQTEEDRRLS